MFRFALAVVLAIAAVPLHAQVPDKDSLQFEASMLVTGSLDIETDGSVSGHVLDHEEKVPAYITSVIGRAVGGWRFEPVMVDGTAVRARARMTLRMVATPVGTDDLAVTLASATFGEYDPKSSDYVTRVRMRAPEYPFFALERGATGTVYLLLKVDRKGRVAEAIAEQVNLDGVSDEETMATLRKRFTESALSVTHRWKFAPPTTGEYVDAPYWSLRVPVNFTMNRDVAGDEAYGKWTPYMPGPRQQAPWLQEEDPGASDAIASGTVQQTGTGYRLLTSLQPES